MTLRENFGSCVRRGVGAAVLVAMTTGCYTGPAAYSRAVNQLEPGMDREQALRLVPVSGKKEMIPGMPRIEIFRFRVCDRMEGCRSQRLVFVDGRFAGPELNPEGLLTGRGLRLGMDPVDLVRAGVVPDIATSNTDVTGKRIWGIRFQDQARQPFALFIFFSDGRLENWFVSPVRNLPKDLFKERIGFYEMAEMLVIIGEVASSHGGSSSSAPGGCGLCGFGFAQ